MIIWGSKNREIDAGEGHFHCPQCRVSSLYKHKKVARYFTLYFIPLFKTSDLGEYVECQGCRQAYKMEVLSRQPLSQAEQLLESIRADLDEGTPVQMACQKLINKGLKDSAAIDIVYAACGGPRVSCRACSLDYRAGVSKCSQCGSATS